MSLIYVTGMSAAGKSTVREELQRRGFEAYDTDETGITSWRNNITGEHVDRPDNELDRTKEWYDQHDWVMSRKKVQKLADRALGKPIFLCGITSNDKELWDLFGKSVCLTVDEETLRYRLKTRTTNDYGKSPDELANILSWHKSSEESYRKLGAIMIDATKPLVKVVDKIVDETIISK